MNNFWWTWAPGKNKDWGKGWGTDLSLKGMCKVVRSVNTEMQLMALNIRSEVGSWGKDTSFLQLSNLSSLRLLRFFMLCDNLSKFLPISFKHYNYDNKSMLSRSASEYLIHRSDALRILQPERVRVLRDPPIRTKPTRLSQPSEWVRGKIGHLDLSCYLKFMENLFDVTHKLFDVL